MWGRCTFFGLVPKKVRSLELTSSALLRSSMFVWMDGSCFHARFIMSPWSTILIGCLAVW